MAGYPPPPGPPPADAQSGYPPPGPQPSYSPVPPPPAKGRRTGLAAFAVLIILIAVIAGGLFLFRDRISGDVNSLQVGDCIDEPSDTSAISDVQHQPCVDPHDGEVFALITYAAADGAAYPGTGAFDDIVRQECLPMVQAYTGRTLQEIDQAGLSYAYFYPTFTSWTDNNDRGVTCYIEKSDGTKLVGSVRVATASPAQS